MSSREGKRPLQNRTKRQKLSMRFRENPEAQGLRLLDDLGFLVESPGFVPDYVLGTANRYCIRS